MAILSGDEIVVLLRYDDDYLAAISNGCLGVLL